MPLQRNQYNKLSNFATTIETVGDVTRVVYHKTAIVSWDAHSVTLNTGGYRSATTKKKMNQASHQFGLGYGVSQRDGSWFIRCPHSEFILPGDVFIFIRPQS